MKLTNFYRSRAGNFIDDFSYYPYPPLNLGSDTVLVDQLQNLVDNCIREIRATDQKIEIFSKNNNAIFTLGNINTKHLIVSNPGYPFKHGQHKEGGYCANNSAPLRY